MKLSSEKKKEMLAQYKLMKPDMGILAVINLSSNKYFLEATPNLKGKLNSTTFQLKSGGHPHKVLQKDWKELGAEQFEIKILEQIEYDEDETKTYADELELLKLIWIDKLQAKGVALY